MKRTINNRIRFVLIVLTDGLSESYVYDPVGNMTAKTKNGVKTQYSYNAANQLVQSVTSGDTTKYSYDANGNLVKSENVAGGAWSYAYNALGLLAQFTREDGYSESYTYNANRLLSSITDNEGTTTLTWDILQGEGVVIGAARNGEATSYAYGLERISASTGKTRTEYVYDGRGSVAAEISYNDSWYSFGGTLAKKNAVSKSFTPFGEQIGEATSGFGYNGEYYNAATGMVYLRARFYAPEMNRFSQKDLLRGSVTQPGSLNRYLYVQNDPMNYIDPSGEALKSIISRAVNTVVSKVTSSPTVQKAVSVARKVIAPVAKAVTTVAQKVAATSVGRAVSAVVQKAASMRQAVTTTASKATSQAAQSAASHAANLRAATQTGPTGTAASQNAGTSLWPEDYYSRFPSVTAPSVAEMMDNIYYCQQKRTEEANERLDEYNRQEASAIAGAQEYLDTMIFNPNKEDLEYQDGPNRTLGVGWEMSAAFVARVSTGTQLVKDGKGNIAIVRYVSFGGGTPSASASIIGTYTNAETIADLKGWGYAAGLSGPYLGGEVIGGEGYSGGTLSYGGSPFPIPAEGHGEVTYTSVQVITPLVDAFGLRDEVEGLITEAGGAP